MANASLSVITVSAVSEADVRSGRVTLLLRLAGGATWRLIDSVVGIAVTAEGVGAIPITQAQQMHPQELKLSLAPVLEFDPPSSSALHITVSHLCEKSLLQLVHACPCTLAMGSEGAAASAAGLPLTAQVPVSDGGMPAGRPGAPEVVPLESHDAVAVRWAPPRDEGGSQVEGYVWVEPGQPHWPIELSHDGGGSLLAVLRGFGRATMLLSGAVAAVNAGGFSPPSAEWVGGIFGQPAPPRDVALSYWQHAPGTTLRLDWQLPEGGWGGGFRIRHHRLRLWRLRGEVEGDRGDAATLRTARAAETSAAEAPRRGRWELAAVLRLRAGVEGATPAEAAALAAETEVEAAGEAGQAAALRVDAVAEPRLANRTKASAAEVEAEAEAEVEAETEVGPGGGRSVLLKGLRPGSRYAAQLVAVNSAGDESAAPPFCTAAELAARDAPTSCAPEAVVPELERELEWPNHGGLMLSGGLIGLLLVVAAACACARTARRRGSGRRASDSASDGMDGGGAGNGGAGRSVKRRDDHPQPLPPPVPPAPPTPPAAAPTHPRTLLYRATQPIWRVFAEDREGRSSGSGAGVAGTAGGTTTHLDVPPRAEPTRQRTLLSRATRPIWRVFAEQRDDRSSGSPSPGGQIGLTVTV